MAVAGLSLGLLVGCGSQEEVKAEEKAMQVRVEQYASEVDERGEEIETVFEEVDSYRADEGYIKSEHWQTVRVSLNALAEELEIEYRLTYNDTERVAEIQELIRDAQQSNEDFIASGADPIKRIEAKEEKETEKREAEKDALQMIKDIIDGEVFTKAYFDEDTKTYTIVPSTDMMNAIVDSAEYGVRGWEDTWDSLIGLTKDFSDMVRDSYDLEGYRVELAHGSTTYYIAVDGSEFFDALNEYRESPKF